MCSAQPLQVELHLLKSHRVEDAAHQTGLFFQSGKISLENSRSDDHLVWKTFRLQSLPCFVRLRTVYLKRENVLSITFL